MLQRKQTLFMLLAVVLSVVCLSMPLGVFTPTSLGSELIVYNLLVTGLAADGGAFFGICPLFVILVTTATIVMMNIFAYKNRPLQAKVCSVCAFLLLGWYASAAAYWFTLQPEGYAFTPSWTLFLPLASFILLLRARAAILADERLVKAADRIRP